MPNHTVLNPADLIPLSQLRDELDVPIGGWGRYLDGRGVDILADDIGRPAITRAAARELLTERREQQEAAERKRRETEQRAIEADEQQRAQIWKGIPAGLIPDGVAPAAAMLQAAHDAQPRRQRVLDDALAGESLVYHPIRSEAEWTVGGGHG